MTYVIGLTGGIGSGKTAVSDRFAELGISVADADVAAREVVEPGTAALTKITEHFGKTILTPDGILDRAALRAIIFKDESERRWLESVTVPAILKNLRKILDDANSTYAILMLSSGSGQSPWIHRQLVVDVSEEVQIARVQSRDANDEKQIRAIMATQPSRQQRLEYADDVINNETNISALHAQIAKLHEQYLLLAKRHIQSP